MKSFNLTSISRSFNAKGYRSAVVSIKVPAAATGTGTISLTDELGTSLNALAWEGTRSLSTIAITGYGSPARYDYVVDVTKTGILNITMSSALSGADVTVSVYFLYDEVSVVKQYGKNVFFSSASYALEPNTFYRLKVRLNSDTYDNVQRVVRFTSSIDDATFANKNCFVDGQSGMTPINYIILNDLSEKEIWFYNDSDKVFKAAPDYAASSILIRYEFIPSENLERCFAMPHNAYTNVASLGPFQYVKVVADLESAGKSTYFSLTSAKDGNDNFIAPTFFLSNGRKPLLNEASSSILFHPIGGTNPGFVYIFKGENTHGTFVLKYENSVSSFNIAQDYYGSELFGPTTSNFAIKVYFSNKPFTNEVNPLSKTIAEREKYKVESYDIDGNVVDAYGEDVLVRIADNRWAYYQFGLDGIRTDVTFDGEHCPSMIEGETVKFARLIPIIGSRPVGQSETRVVLFTSKNRILYNKVRNSYGCELSYFREAELINTKKRWYPVSTKAEASAVAKYLPIFPQYDYSQFNGRVGSGTDAFGLAKPQRGSSVGELLEDFHKDNIIGKLAYSSFSISEVYGTIWGNYNLTDGDPWLAVTANGEKWYIVETFGSVADFADITNLKVDLSPILTNAGGYTAGDLSLCWRKYNVPSDTEKEPETPFIIGPSCVVSGISSDDSGTIVTFVDDSALYADQYDRYKFTNYRQVVFFKNNSGNAEYDYICNDVKADGSDNTGVFFRLVRIEGTHQYRLFGDVGDPYEGRKVCRHIHSVSESASGFLIATGENYTKLNDAVPIFEGGFLFYLPANNRNADVGLANPQKNFGEMFRICSSMLGVNRACGAYLKSDIDNTLIYVSDDIYGELSKGEITIPGRTESLRKRPFGVISGKLVDVDNQSNFGCVAELKNAAIGLVYNKGRFAVCLFGGDAVFSSDFGKTWHQETIFKVKKGQTIYYTDVTGICSDGGFFYDNNKIIFK